MERQLSRQINVVSILRDVLRGWSVILLLAVSASLFANIWVTSRYQPVYTTKITFAVTAQGTNSNIYQNLTSAQQLASRFTQILGSTVLRNRVMDDLGLTEFTAETSATQISETNMVELEVSAGSAMEAYDVLRSIMENYNSVSDYVIGGVILEVIQPPSIPTQPSNPLNVRSAMVRSFGVTALAVALYLAWRSYMRDTIKSEGQMAEKVDARRLGTIYRERKQLHSAGRKKAGVSMLIDNPLRSFWFVESNKRMASRVRSHMERKNRKVLMVTSVMENEGKSTVASNLALALAQEVDHVLLIDCDFRKPSLHKIFELPNTMQIDLPRALERRVDVSQIMLRYGQSNLYLVTNNAPSSAETVLASGALNRLIDACREWADLIILDTAPMAQVSDTEDIARLADASLLVVREDTVLAAHINDAIDALNRTEGKVIGCVLNYASRGLAETAGSYGYGGYYGKGAK